MGPVKVLAASVTHYVGFGARLLGAVLFLTGVWHERTVIAGLEIAPGPLVVAKSRLRSSGWWSLRLGGPADFAGCFYRECWSAASVSD